MSQTLAPRATAPAPDTGPTAKDVRRLKTLNMIFELRAFIALGVLIVVFGALSDSFLTVDNLITMTKHVAINAVLALGMLLVILKGGIDLSVGSIVGLSGIVCGELLGGIRLPGTETIAYPPVWVVVILAIAVGTFVGLVNGMLVTRFNVAPFIATLGMLYVARGTALLISGGSTYPDLGGNAALGNTGFSYIGNGRPLGLPFSIWVMVVLALLVAVLLTQAPFGRWLYATGGNERASELSGVPVRTVKLVVYMLSGACAAITGIIIASELTSAAPQAGETFELNAIAAVVIGGAALSGGRGNVRGTLVGAFVIGFLADGLVILGVSTFWQIFIKGAVIILAVMLDQGQQRFQRRGAAVAASVEAEHAPAGSPVDHPSGSDGPPSSSPGRPTRDEGSTHRS
ncbi:ABC transporter permease [Nocardioides aurantiacus]|uniref:Monosaccharide ABC transporter membrane protein (CUT2 family) n=1 Tax=Nocardioides aurantiacus TaxID=86796 RepID=A0A3N2CZU3_9ACTN|nr:ABC transporter permease [Nocardioides aurantiacus]ROR93040.1 monosaccharide ABC transporter membrane protein (CUT2 family) [Nocardioides aurantiacus]